MSELTRFGFACLLALGFCIARDLAGHEGCENSSCDAPKAQRLEEPIRGQGRSTSIDRAYAMQAQTCANQISIDRPAGKRWISVADCIPFAKREWGVKIVDETCDAEVGKLEFAMAFGAVDREFALPLFLQALASAVERRQDCYVEQDDTSLYSFGFKSHNKGTVHIRRIQKCSADCCGSSSCQEAETRESHPATRKEDATPSKAESPKKSDSQPAAEPKKTP